MRAVSHTTFCCRDLAQACTTSGEYTLGGCSEIVTCAPKAPPVMPPNGMSIGGYVLQAETNLLANNFDVTAVCDTGYAGTAVPVPCTANGDDYTLVSHQLTQLDLHNLFSLASRTVADR